MALTTTISKSSITKINDEDYTVSFHVTIKDDNGVFLLEKDYAERWWDKTPMSMIEEKVQDKIKADWKDCVSEKEKFEAIQVDTTASNIQTAINDFVNKEKV